MTKLLVIDTETGGLDPERHSLLSIAAVVWDDCHAVGEIEILVAEPEVSVTAQAMEINRIDLVNHARHAVAPAHALQRLLEFATVHFAFELARRDQIVLAGHNVGFDIAFLRRLCRLAGADYPRIFSHRSLDTASVLRFLSLCGRLPESAAASSEAFAHFGIAIGEEARHTALGDARATAELLSRLVLSTAVPANAAA